MEQKEIIIDYIDIFYNLLYSVDELSAMLAGNYPIFHKHTTADLLQPALELFGYLYELIDYRKYIYESLSDLQIMLFYLLSEKCPILKRIFVFSNDMLFIREEYKRVYIEDKLVDGWYCDKKEENT